MKVGAHARRNDVQGAKALQAIRIGHDEVVAVRHLHLRQRFRIHRIAVADQLVERKKIGGERIDLVVAERSRHVVRHGPAHVVKDGGRVGVVIGNRLHSIDAVSERLPTDERRVIGRDAAFGGVAMAG